jgi:hypothetical protein
VTRPFRRQAVVILALTPIVLAVDALAWLIWAAWHLMPWLLATAAVVAAYRAGQRRPTGTGQPVKVIRAQPEEDQWP